MFDAFRLPEEEVSGGQVGIFQELIDGLGSTGYWRHNVRSGKTTGSKSLSRLYGLDENNALQDWSQTMSAIHADDRLGAERLLTRAKTLGEDYSTRLRVRRGDGSWRVFAGRTMCARGADGAVENIFGVVMDVTDSEIYNVLAVNGNDIIVQTDLAGRITYISQSVEDVTGFRPDEVVGERLADIIHPDDFAELQALVQETLRHPERRARCVEYRAMHKNGQAVWLESRPTALIFPGTPRPIGTTDVVRDITERKAAEVKLEFANVLLNSQMEAAVDGILLIDEDLRVITFNKRFAEMFGVDAGELSGASAGDLDRRIAAATRDRLGLVDRLPYAFDHDNSGNRFEIETADGRILEGHTTALRTPAGAFVARSWFLWEVTQRRQELAHALRMSRFDQLTGLANRSVFVEAVQQATARAKRGGNGFAVLYLDLDHFKDVNDTKGHPVGDDLLRAVARRLRANTREGDTVARFGGDEFGIVVTNLESATDAALLAGKLIKILAEPYSIMGQKIYSGASIGIDVFGPDRSDAETLLSHADLALYRAKAEGRGSFHFFTAALDSDVRTRVALANELRQAIAHDELFLVYQPQVDARTGRITGVEALVRWLHPERGLLSPTIFIPVAEQMGLIGDIGKWVLQTACHQAATWFRSGVPPIRMCVNLSSLQFKEPLALERDILGALKVSELAPELLELELTESVLMSAASQHGDVLTRLRAEGISIAIDDFGTGYSSLDYLRRYPVNRIKIAQAFVDHIEDMPGNAAIVKATIGLARELKIAVIAEGVETEGQLALLDKWGCGEIQGYLFARPAKADEIESHLLTGSIDRPSAFNWGAPRRASLGRIAKRA